MEFQLFQVDAFTDRVFGGNPAAIIPLESWLSDDLLQHIATENNLSETAYFVQQSGRIQLRWFTPVYEVDLCGHATLAAAHVWFKHLGETGSEVVFETRSGELTVTPMDQGYEMNFPADEIQPVDPPSALLEGLQQSPLACYRGKDDYLVILPSESAVQTLKPNFNAIAQLENNRGVIVSAKGDQVDFVSRCFFPSAGINEDPVTGSAHTTMAPYWAAQLGKHELTARQISARIGELSCAVRDDRVLLTGRAITYMMGTIYL